MTRTATEHWLAELQARFGAVLRAPLSAAGGTLHSDPVAYPAGAIDDVLPGPKLTAAERLGIYQRQYWMRLLRLLQEQYPLTTHLCGAWGFNQHAIGFLCSRPPHGCDLGHVVEGFDEFLAATVQGDPVRHTGARPLPRAALVEAANLDAAFRRVFMAPEEAAFRPSAGEAVEFTTRRLRFSRAFAIVEESWPLFELRARVVRTPSDDQVALPSALERPRSWALHRTERGFGQLALDREQARLLELLGQHALGAALGILESECEAGVRADLPERTQRFLTRAVQHGFFTGFA